MRTIFSAYRKADFADPDGFVVQLGSVLEDYPDWVVAQVSHPKTGIQRKSKFVPVIAEIVTACEEAYSPVRYAEQWDARAQQQAAERQALPPSQHSKPAGKIITYRELPEGVRPIGVFEADGRTAIYRG